MSENSVDNDYSKKELINGESETKKKRFTNDRHLKCADAKYCESYLRRDDKRRIELLRNRK